MPAGVTWTRYLKAVTAAFLSMAAGAQVVHYYYKPLEDLDILIQIEMKRLKGTKKMRGDIAE